MLATEGDSDATTEVTSEVPSDEEPLPSGRFTQPVPLEHAPSSSSTTASTFSREMSSTTEQPPPQISGNNKVLIICSGPSTNENNLQKYLQQLGMDVVAFDIIDGIHMDITDDSVWDPLFADIRNGKFAAVVASPPCSTFSRLRGIPGGPPILRGISGPAVYGLRTLTPKQQEQVRTHNLIALRAISACESIAVQGGIFVLEQPAVRDGEVSLFHLNEAVALAAKTSVTHWLGAQCPFGAATRKLTSWLTAGLDFSDMPKTCPHSKKQWFLEGTGQSILATHPPSRGSCRYYATLEEARATRSTSNEFVSSKLSAYPPLLNRYLASKIYIAASRCRRPRPMTPLAPASQPSTWDDRLGKERVKMRQHLRGVPSELRKDALDRQAIGGLRNAKHSISRLHCVSTFGLELGNCIQEVLLSNHRQCCVEGKPDSSWIRSFVNLVGSQSPDASAPLDAVAAVRKVIAEKVGYVGNQRTPVPYCTTRINAELLESWRKKANDPDTAVCEWLLSGAPAGITMEPEACGIFPATDDSAEFDPEELMMDYRAFNNIAGVEEGETAERTVKAYLGKDYLKSFNTVQELQEFVGHASPILNKIGIISKKGKDRMILDTKASRIKQCSAKYQRVILPRLLDAIISALKLLATCKGHESLSFFVLDFTEAFWQIPLSPSERRFFAARLKIDGVEIFLLFLRMVQGLNSHMFMQ